MALCSVTSDSPCLRVLAVWVSDGSQILIISVLQSHPLWADIITSGATIRDAGTGGVVAVHVGGVRAGDGVDAGGGGQYSSLFRLSSKWLNTSVLCANEPLEVLKIFCKNEKLLLTDATNNTLLPRKNNIQGKQYQWVLSFTQILFLLLWASQFDKVGLVRQQ